MLRTATPVADASLLCSASINAMRRVCAWSRSDEKSTGSALTRVFLIGGMIVGGCGRVRNREKLIGSPGSDAARRLLRDGVAAAGTAEAADNTFESIVTCFGLHRGEHARPGPYAR